jgi:hypothetical protein
MRARHLVHGELALPAGMLNAVSVVCIDTDRVLQE